MLDAPSERTVSVEFDCGTVLLRGSLEEGPHLPGVVWDPRASAFRTPAYRFADVASRIRASGHVLDGDLSDAWSAAPRACDDLALRPYQEDALRAWTAFGRRGVVALPTGAGKTRVAIAAIRMCGVPTVVLCPTRALLGHWATELGDRLGEPIGIVGDGDRRFERVTVMTFESAFRHLDAVGQRFGLLVVDEVHHFASGARVDALAACAAPARLGLTATAPPPGSDGALKLGEYVGPIVLEVSMGELVGTHLAELTVTRINVRLAPDERELYDRLVAPFKEQRRAFFRRSPGATFTQMLRALAATPDGRQAIWQHARGADLAYFPRAKRAVVRSLLARHRADRTIVFTARAHDAYRIGEDNLVPVITGEVLAEERERILAKFREGTLTAIASARVLNEGIDVPDARVAIVTGGTLGAREHVQRLGRVLRPSPGKHAIAYEVVTTGTMDERNAGTRGREHAAVRR